MEESLINRIILEARNCALLMQDQVEYIQQELFEIESTEELRREIENMCSTLIGTKHEVLTELFELKEVIDSAEISKKTDEIIRRRIKHIVNCFHNDIEKMHQLVTQLQQRNHSLLCSLVSASSTNIIMAFTRVADLTDFL